MKIVEDWKGAWRWFSVQALAFLAILPIVWLSLPPQINEWVPEEWRPFIVAGFAIGGIAGRLIEQKQPEA